MHPVDAYGGNPGDIPLTKAEAARVKIARQRWPKGIRCPFCDSDNVQLLGRHLRGARKRTHPVWKCKNKDCVKQQFTPTTHPQENVVVKNKKKPEKWIEAHILSGEIMRIPSQVDLARHLVVSKAMAADMLFEIWGVPRKHRTKASEEKNGPEAPKGDKPD